MAHVPPRSRGTLRAQADRSYVSRTLLLPVQHYLHTESIGGIVLLVATLVALTWENSPLDGYYHGILETHLRLNVGLFLVDLTVEEWINDGLMALFFFVIGLEIKRELLFGQLSTLRSAALPAVAAIGGMVVPASIYLAFNLDGAGMRGWGIPMATDIAFALGVLALLGRRIPMELRVFMLGLAVVDDLGAISIGNRRTADRCDDRCEQVGTPAACGHGGAGFSHLGGGAEVRSSRDRRRRADRVSDTGDSRV